MIAPSAPVIIKAWNGCSATSLAKSVMFFLSERGWSAEFMVEFLQQYRHCLTSLSATGGGRGLKRTGRRASHELLRHRHQGVPQESPSGLYRDLRAPQLRCPADILKPYIRPAGRMLAQFSVRQPVPPHVSERLHQSNSRSGSRYRSHMALRSRSRSCLRHPARCRRTPSYSGKTPCSASWMT